MKKTFTAIILTSLFLLGCSKEAEPETKVPGTEVYEGTQLETENTTQNSPRSQNENQ